MPVFGRPLSRICDKVGVKMVRKKINSIEKELQRTKKDLEDLEIYIGEFSSFLPLAICTVNPLKIIIEINQAFQDLASYNPTEIVGESFKKIFLEKKKVENLLDEAQKKEIIKRRELTLVSKEKKEIPVSLSISIRKDEEGSFIGYFLALSDISEIKKSREELEMKVKTRTKDLENSRKALMNILEDVEEAKERAEEEKNRTLTIITNLFDGLLVFNKENRLSLINPQAEELFDIKGRDITGRSISELRTFPTLKPLIKFLGEEIKGVFRKELTLKKGLTLEISTVPITRNEEELGTLVIIHDITREKRIERMKTEFVSLAAHQLRTPLSAIKWTLNMFLTGDLGKITEEQRGFIEKTYQSNERMINLINDLLDVTRIEEGKYIFKPQFSSIENIVQFIINSLKGEIKKKKIKFTFEEPKKKLPKVKVDVEKMRLAINNLIDNAIRYTPTGGEVTVSLKHGKKEVEFSVRDSGVGIPEDQKERIFTKFFRGANVMRMDTEGTGLGLFIAKNIIEAHKGKVWFESKEGEGTTFYFSLPVKKEFEEFLKEF